MSTVLVSGATGFLGSHIVKALLSENHKVLILKRTFSNTFRIDEIKDRVHNYDVDVQNVEVPFTEHNPDVVIHTACSYGRHGEPIHEIVESNLVFGLKILDAAIKNDVRTFINTDTFFTAHQKHMNVYSLSKKQFTDWLKQQSENIQVLNMKLEHVYGPTDDCSKFVPWLISQLFEEADEIPLTKGEQKRDFIYVDDVVSAFLKVLDKTAHFSNFAEFSVGTGKSITLKDFVKTAKRVFNSEITPSGTALLFGAVPYRTGEIMEPNPNNRKLFDLGWKPSFTLEEGLKRYMINYKKRMKGEV